jgi:hypothetical protein
MAHRCSLLVALAAGLALMVTAPVALAGPDVTDTSYFVESETGLQLFTGHKDVKIYTDTNAENPHAEAGRYTYVYTVYNDASSLVPLIGVAIQIPAACQPATINYFPGEPVTADPDSPGTYSNGQVEWTFFTNSIAPGSNSSDLYLTSVCGPGPMPDMVYTVDAEGSLFADGLCLGPSVMPQQECNLDVTKQGCVEQPPDSGGDACDGKATKLTFQYTGLGCDATSNLQSPFVQECHGGANGDQPVNIEVYGEKLKCLFWYCWMDKVVFTSQTGVNVGDSVVVDAASAGQSTLGHELKIRITNPNQQACGSAIESDEFVTDCSQPLGPGNQFGSALITSLTSTQGGTVGLPSEEDCVKEINVAPPPHCLGAVKEIKLRYTGMACGSMTNSQSELLSSCTDAAAPSADPVRIIVSNGTSAPPASTPYIDMSGVNVGDIITVKASDIGASYFTSHTGFWIKDGSNNLIQSGKFDADCDQPLNLGDQFGALQVFGLTTTQGGTVALAQQVDYTYTVSNPNDSAVSNVSLDDDKLGNIASGVSLAPSESATFTASALIGQDTTNTVTATGQVDSLQCNAATAQDTITVHQPPDPGMICTSDVQAMLLRYTGPEIDGANVQIIAGDFWHPISVTYSSVNLIPGVTVLSMPSEHGYTVDAVAHNAKDLGLITTIKINGVAEKLDTSCGHCGCGCSSSAPFKSNAGAPLYYSSNRSTNWFVVDFTQK